jgi:lipopolysaccharide/colanic/teichoic acid biosynthesis glycosyltransferase
MRNNHKAAAGDEGLVVRPALGFQECSPVGAGGRRITFPQFAHAMLLRECRLGVAPAARDRSFACSTGKHHAWYLPVKAAVEWMAALALLMLSGPLVLFLAALVKLTSPGPAFYFQTRLGRNGRPYRICKIRTMRHNCEAVTGPVWAAKNDNRVTALGQFLRSTHLDELPQLWNVLTGEMSLIGPRPERPELYPVIEREVPNYQSRLQLRPGITGLAQMRLPADTEVAGVRLKLAHDLYYIRQVSPWLDARIVASTAFYFLAAAADALRTAAVRSYGKEVERGVDESIGYLAESA